MTAITLTNHSDKHVDVYEQSSLDYTKLSFPENLTCGLVKLCHNVMSVCSEFVCESHIEIEF